MGGDADGCGAVQVFQPEGVRDAPAFRLPERQAGAFPGLFCPWGGMAARRSVPFRPDALSARPRTMDAPPEEERTAGGYADSRGRGGQQAEESDAASGLPVSRMAREHGYCPFFLDCIGCVSFRAVHARGRHGAERQAVGYPAFASGKQGWTPETTQPKLQGGRSMPCLDEGRSRRAAPQAEACRERRIP